MQLRLLLLSLALTAACSHGTGHPARQADGSYSLSCKGPLSDCLHHAERLCKDQGYTVIDARDVKNVLGHESGQSQVVIQKSEATIACGDAPRPALRLVREPSAETVVSGPPAPPAAPPPTPPPSAATTPAPVCIAGATQACIGPGGCSGGQACASDGNHFEACDCGH